jgi:hypothetical protein
MLVLLSLTAIDFQKCDCFGDATDLATPRCKPERISTFGLVSTVRSRSGVSSQSTWRVLQRSAIVLGRLEKSSLWPVHRTHSIPG